MTRIRLRRHILTAVLVGVTGVTATSTQVPSREPARAVETVTVDFFASAADGRLITDLTSEEVNVRIDGRARKIQSLRWISMAGGGRADAAWPGILPPPFGTNLVPDDARAVLLVLDDDSFRPGREGPLREAVNRFLVELWPRDRVALVTVPYGGLKVDFTTDRAEVSAALSRIVGQAQADQTGSDLACRTRRTLEAVGGLLDSLAGGRGPTMVLFVSSGLAAPRRDAALALGPGMCELTTDHFEQVGVFASAARAHFFIIQPEDNTTAQSRSPVETLSGGGFDGSDNPRAGLEHLGGVTGGHIVPLLTPRESSLSRISRETSGYYLLAFEPDSSDRNGRRYSVDLRVSRRDVTLRTRPAVTIARRDRAATQSSPSPRDILRQARVFRDLPLRAVGYASWGDGKDLKVVTVLEAAEPGVSLKAAAAGLFDAKGRLTAQWTASAEELANTPIMTALVAPPGTYRLRMAALDTMGRAGSADYELVAGLAPAGPLRLSGLVLGLSRGGGFRPVLQFGSEPVATVYVEIYGRSEATPGVMVEIATSENGPPIITVPAAIAQTSDADRRIATAALPIGALPAGDFAVRVVVSVSGQSAGRVVRTLRKTQM